MVSMTEYTERLRNMRIEKYPLGFANREVICELDSHSCFFEVVEIEDHVE